MDENSLKKIIEQGETATVEFKSWVKAASMRERINLVVPELIAFANYKGGTVYLGIEDDGTVTGCSGKYDTQNICKVFGKMKSFFLQFFDIFHYKGAKNRVQTN